MRYPEQYKYYCWFARKLDKTNLRPVLSPEAMLGMGQGRLW